MSARSSPSSAYSTVIAVDRPAWVPSPVGIDSGRYCCRRDRLGDRLAQQETTRVRREHQIDRPALVGVVLPCAPARWRSSSLASRRRRKQLDHDRRQEVPPFGAFRLGRAEHHPDAVGVHARPRTVATPASRSRSHQARPSTSDTRQPCTNSSATAAPSRSPRRPRRPAPEPPPPSALACRAARAFGGRTRSTGFVAISPRFTASATTDRNVALVSATVLADERAEQLRLPRRHLLGAQAPDAHVTEPRCDPLDPIDVLAERRRPHPHGATVLQPPRRQLGDRARSAQSGRRRPRPLGERPRQRLARRRNASSRVRPRTRRGRALARHR